MDDAEVLARARRRVLDRLERLPEWVVEGDCLVGPGTMAILVEGHAGDAILRRTGSSWRAHMDVTFVLDRDRPADTSISDCVSGFGESEIAAIDSTAEQWANGTAQVMYELLAQDGDHATRLGPSDPMGLPGSHVIHGPFQGSGRGEMPDVLVQWATGFGVLHALSPVLAPAVTGFELVGIKFFFGSNAGQDTAEVRIASVADPLGSAALLQLPWPRSEEMAYVRAFALVVQGDQPVAEEQPRGELADAIIQLARLAEAHPCLDDQGLVEVLCQRGVNPLSARRLVAFVPIAFGRALLEPMGVIADPNFENHRRGPRWRARSSRSVTSRPLASVPEYVAARSMAPVLKRSPGFRQLAVRGAEVNAVESLMRQGSAARDVRLTPVIVALGHQLARRLYQDVRSSSSRPSGR